jgi:hypothetical protein
MTTIYKFEPSPTGPYTFQPTLDGVSYVATITWSVFGKRWMFNLNSAGGELIVSRALVGSPEGVSIIDISWADGKVTVTTEVPHKLRVLGTFPLTIQNVAPEIYNGVRTCFVLSPTEFWYDAAEDPGKVTTYGNVHSQVDLVWGYFNTSTLVFNYPAQQFEVVP